MEQGPFPSWMPVLMLVRGSTGLLVNPVLAICNITLLANLESLFELVLWIIMVRNWGGFSLADCVEQT